MNDIVFSKNWRKVAHAIESLQNSDNNFPESDAMLEKVAKAYQIQPEDSEVLRFQKEAVLEAMQEHRDKRQALYPDLEYLAVMTVPEVLGYLAQGNQDTDELKNIFQYFDMSPSICEAILAHPSISYFLIVSILCRVHVSEKNPLFYPFAESKIRALLENPMFFLLMESTPEQDHWSLNDTIDDILKEWAYSLAKDQHLPNYLESTWGDVSYRSVMSASKALLHPEIYGAFMQQDMIDETIGETEEGDIDLLDVFTYLKASMVGYDFGIKITNLEAFWNKLLGTNVQFPRPSWMIEP